MEGLRMGRILIAVLLSVFCTASYAQSTGPTETERAIARAVQANEPKTSREYWISTINAFGDKETVGLIFGMMDNLAFCDEVMRSYRNRYPNNRFFCEPAN